MRWSTAANLESSHVSLTISPIIYHTYTAEFAPRRWEALLQIVVQHKPVHKSVRIISTKKDLALLMQHVGTVGSTQYSAAPEAAKQAAGLAGEPADRRQHRHIEALRDAALAVS